MALGERADGAGPRDCLGATVRAELGEQVTHVRADRVHRHRQLAGDLRSRLVGRQITQHPGLAVCELFSQAVEAQDP